MVSDAGALIAALTRTIEKESENIEKARTIFLDSLAHGGKILACGNGGSASQAQHFSGELVVRFRVNRKPIPAIALNTDSSIISACGNDFGFEEIFSKQVEALAGDKDVLFCLSTSGNSKNILKAAEKAREKGCKVVSLTGSKENMLEKASDLTIKVSSEDTARIQEISLFLIHYFAGEIEMEMAK
ncbi:MAG: SIS domain-containing protein [archaeon]|jgi:D-sedoheptulose 7-phosphate isomerase|nr:SIS domain-containing protein [archaeon]